MSVHRGGRQSERRRAGALRLRGIEKCYLGDRLFDEEAEDPVFVGNELCEEEAADSGTK